MKAKQIKSYGTRQVYRGAIKHDRRLRLEAAFIIGFIVGITIMGILK